MMNFGWQELVQKGRAGNMQIHGSVPCGQSRSLCATCSLRTLSWSLADCLYTQVFEVICTQGACRLSQTQNVLYCRGRKVRSGRRTLRPEKVLCNDPMERWKEVRRLAAWTPAWILRSIQTTSLASSTRLEENEEIKITFLKST